MPREHLSRNRRKERIRAIVYSMIAEYLNTSMLPFLDKRKDNIASLILAWLKATNETLNQG